MKGLIFILITVFTLSQVAPWWLSRTDQDSAAWISSGEEQSEDKAKEDTKKEVEKFHSQASSLWVSIPYTSPILVAENGELPAFDAEPHTPPPDRC